MKDRRERSAAEVPRWQQGFRPAVFGDEWDAMSPRQRRRAFVADLIIAALGAAMIFVLFS